MNCTEIWGVTSEKLQTLLDRDSFERYLTGLVPVNFNTDSSTLTLGVLNKIQEVQSHNQQSPI